MVRIYDELWSSHRINSHPPACSCGYRRECGYLHVCAILLVLSVPDIDCSACRSYTIFFFAAYQSGSLIQYPAVDTLCPVAGIAFMMINVRVGMGWAQRAQTSSGITSRRAAEQTFAMRPVAVDITRVVEKTEDVKVNNMESGMKRVSSELTATV